MKSIIIQFNKIDVVSGSVIMALGIFSLGAMQQIPLIGQYSKTITLFLFLLWFLMIISFVTTFINHSYRKLLISIPVKSFAIGTWIAGTSVICVLMVHEYQQLQIIIECISIFNLFAWFAYILFCISQFKRIVVHNLGRDVHGVILLSTVSTQSMVCLLINVFHGEVSNKMVIFFIVAGFAFYLFSMILILMRFIQKWGSIHELKNTDCIIHGALSITGLAMTQSQVFSSEFLNCFWFFVLALFILIETFEVVRAVARVKLFGLKKALFTYDVSQWSRNFTFGMLYYFTYNLVTLYEGKMPWTFQLQFLELFAWVVLILLLMEVILFFQSKINALLLK
ncbi:hypothetical protein MTP04_32080 [Lysinibacillus sp. PLM2]|nr:hypothetical protein MTP04_32080 [Lysinibacillus sp. PLM2]